MRFQAAKWIKIGALLDADELSALLDALHPLELFPLSGFVEPAQLQLDPAQFVSTYRATLTSWGQQRLPATAWTRVREVISLQDVEGRQLVRITAPCVQVQGHHLTYSSVDHSFRPMVFGADPIFWGLQWSFPQVYQDLQTQEFVEKPTGPNAELFHAIRRWMRDATVATPMLVNGARMNLPVRLGRRCFAWIHEHPHLKARGLHVA